jgi:hypothetical protein
MLHSPPQWREWVSSRELVEQRRGVIPRRVMAQLCCVRALNARTRVQEQVRVRGSLERGEARSRGCEPSSEVESARGGASPRARRNPLEGGVSPRARRNPLEEVRALERGGTCSREAFALERGGTCSRGPLMGPLQWSAGTIAAWAVPCARV